MALIRILLDESKADKYQLARDMITIAMADGKLSEEERSAMNTICQRQGISEAELQELLQGAATMRPYRVPATPKEVNDYMVELVRVMGADGYSSPEEVYLLEIIAARMGLKRCHVQALLLMNANHHNFPGNQGVRVLDSFMRNIIDPKGSSSAANRQHLGMMFDVVAENTNVIGDPAEDEALLRNAMEKAEQLFLENTILIKEFSDIGVDFALLLSQERELAIRRWLGH